MDIKIKNATAEMIFPVSGKIRIFNNTPFYLKKIGTMISGESRKLNPLKQAQSQLCKLIIAHLMTFSYVFIVIDIY